MKLKAATLTGGKELTEMLKKMALNDRDIVDVLMDAARPMHAAAQQLAPVQRVRDALVLVEGRRIGKMTPRVWLSMNFKVAPDAYWWEYGTQERFHKSGKSVGAMPAQPYFRPAVRLLQGSTSRAVREGLKKLIEREQKKHRVA